MRGFILATAQTIARARHCHSIIVGVFANSLRVTDMIYTIVSMDVLPQELDDYLIIVFEYIVD